MRGFRSLICCTVLILIVVFGRLSSQAKDALQLKFTAKPVKAAFHVREKVMFRFTIQNQSETDVIVSQALLLNYDIHLEIKNDAGTVLSWCGVIVNRIFLDNEYLALHPGKSLSVDRQVSCDDSHDSGYSFPGPGEYFVTATYRFPVSPKKLRDNPGPVPVPSGTYKAELARFTIVDNTR